MRVTIMTFICFITQLYNQLHISSIVCKTQDRNVLIDVNPF